MTRPDNKPSFPRKNLPSRVSSGPGRLFIVSAPSGAGKTTLCRRMLNLFKDMVYSVSTTTRPPRPGEVQGKDYFFVSEEDFLQGIAQHKWAEWANVHDHYYGTSAEFIQTHLEQGRNVLLDIDVQGMQQILEQFPESVTIFILPPSMESLKQRMTHRATDSPAVIAKRLKNAEDEMARKDSYRHVLVNDDLEEATLALAKIIQSHSGRG